MKHPHSHQDALILKSGEGREYICGNMTAIFKADENETDARYSISEWWMQPHSDGPGAHLHETHDEVFYVLEGSPSILVGEEWVETEKGSMIRIPANTLHDFANRKAERCGLLNFFIPGGFERNMPAIVKWFEENP
ncbi:cupin domain-containing protein [Porifericola rhodea]|uniref:cupin domain-containing protein n=1 Tax=Porifericola rhodea TaxID=930972 RepID=UPI002666D36D|nr:cupin domain-containing protein [Porifericola rhodea]WKN30315.1 cupin domain-containing protein [Porifericola rhodea]